jgi:hypothetical protein
LSMLEGFSRMLELHVRGKGRNIVPAAQCSFGNFVLHSCFSQ